jgi:hypothetical protein
MPQPVKLSDNLVNAARAAAPLAHRSLAAQVEHWAALGAPIERPGLDQSTLLKRHQSQRRSYAPTPEAVTARGVPGSIFDHDFRDAVPCRNGVLAAPISHAEVITPASTWSQAPRRAR